LLFLETDSNFPEALRFTDPPPGKDLALALALLVLLIGDSGAGLGIEATLPPDLRSPVPPLRVDLRSPFPPL
jgi:hypothetical protein